MWSLRHVEKRLSQQFSYSLVLVVAWFFDCGYGKNFFGFIVKESEKTMRFFDVVVSKHRPDGLLARALGYSAHSFGSFSIASNNFLYNSGASR